MISSEVSDIFTHRLRKLAKSGLPAQELAANLERLMEAERAQKLPQDQTAQGFIHPFFSGRQAHLNLV